MTHRVFSWWLLIGLWVGAAAHAQSIVIVTVLSHGQGLTEAAAIKDAVIEAVGRVSGERIQAQTVTQTKSVESTSGASEHSASHQQRIDSLIRGVVKSSRTLNVARDPVAGLFKAEVEVGVASFRQSEQLQRVKLTVVMGSQGLPRALSNDRGAFTQALLNGASDQLVGSRKFAVLDRQQQGAAQSEFNRITSGGAPVENYVRMQSAAIADFLIVVDVSDFAPGKSVLGSDRAKASARAVVYDYTSGQIRQAVTATALRVLRDGSTADLATQLGADLAEQIINNVFPARVIAFENGNPVINAGFGQFEAGDPVELMRQGPVLRDPYTKESLGHAETLAARGTIETVMPRTAVIRLLDGQELLALKGVAYVVRRSVAPPAPLTPDTPSISVRKGNKHDDW
ncbi:MAG: hypothetical protein QUV35_12980 [Hydrogenophaga sp.]|uniref:hypothetical protein n=1 Tax=Hydrogenophaga sp. TaxID=1904254 RepID=UPI0026019FA6|nr:hypothetical protein [Hydrogenophaga sp.]MDM7943531.1 hypothetical protein [Hydrogenophaga sp.]